MSADTGRDMDPEIDPAAESCWSRIGVFAPGSPSCPELEQVIHCHNCQVYVRAGRSLLGRAPSDAYLADWTEALAQEKRVAAGAALSTLVFRVGAEWLALPTRTLLEVTEPRLVRTVPHVPRGVFQGLVNIAGQTQLCVSLGHLLHIDPEPAAPDAADGEEREHRLVHRRMLVVEKDGERWVFPVEEVLGIAPIRTQDLQPLPVTVAHDQAAFTRGLFPWQGKSVGLLDEELVFSALRRRVTGR